MVSVTAGAAVLLLVAGPSSAADKPRRSGAACAAAGQSVQTAHAAEAAGHAAAAVDAYQACAQQTDCSWLAAECQAKVNAAKAKLPSIVVIANDETGQPVTDVEVLVDGVLRASKLNGFGIPFDPGLHELSLRTGGGAVATKKLMVAEGQQDQLITVTLHPQASKTGPNAISVATGGPSSDSPSMGDPSAPATPTAASGPSTRYPPTKAMEAPAAVPSHWVLPRSPLPYTLAGVGALGIVGGVLTGIWGNKDTTNVENKCSPNCSPSSLNHTKILGYVSDTSFGVGVVVLLVATWTFASSRAVDKPPSPAATLVDVRPLPSGAFASISEAF